MIRRLVIALALCLAFATPALAQAQGKIGVANLMQISSQSLPGQEIEKVLQERFGKERTDLEKMASDLNKKAEELNTQAAALSESARNQRAQAIQKSAQELDTKTADYTRRLSEVQRAVSQQMEVLIGKACSEYGKRNGYALIVDGAAILYAGDASNVTAGILDEVNTQWKAGGAKFDIPPAK